MTEEIEVTIFAFVEINEDDLNIFIETESGDKVNINHLVSKGQQGDLRRCLEELDQQ